VAERDGRGLDPALSRPQVGNRGRSATLVVWWPLRLPLWLGRLLLAAIAAGRFDSLRLMLVGIHRCDRSVCMPKHIYVCMYELKLCLDLVLVYVHIRVVWLL
jgi:hypothetical protein